MRNNKMAKILVVDDEEMIRFAFEQFLNDEGHTPVLAKDAETALEQIEAHRPEIAFLDYRLPGDDGLVVLNSMKQLAPNMAVVFMTAFGTMDVVIRAMQLGAYEYVTKPLDLERVRTLINRILEGKRSLAALKENGETPGFEAPLDRMVGKGAAMQEVFKMIGLLTTQDVTVLVTGESGVGKELVARAIHENSPRQKHPYVAVNCGAMPENLLEAEMFGYEKGAFTGAESRKPGKFEVAEGGSIFLDEIGELQPALQVKLLRVLQERSFDRIGGNTPIHTDARIIAATNKDLYQEVALGRFRKDLFYRLYLVHIEIPPLRERADDIPLLVEHFIRKANLELGRRVRDVTEEAMKRLMTYQWPGNVRELENQIKQAMVVSREDVLPEYLFPLDLNRAAPSGATTEDQLSRASVEAMVEALAVPGLHAPVYDRVIGIVEKALIREALQRTDGNQVHAAELLGLNRSTLRKKRREYAI
jgi:two-component system nitrogen regulation response regulator GlnG